MRPETVALSAEELRKMHAYWRAANYLSVGQIYLLDNPLLREPLRPEYRSFPWRLDARGMRGPANASELGLNRPSHPTP